MDGTRRAAPTRPDRAELASQLVIDVARALNARLPDLTRTMRDLLAARIDELRGDSRLVDLLGASIEGNIDNILHALQHGITVERMAPPTAAVEYARRLAQRGVPLNALVRAYRLGQQNLLQVLHAEAGGRQVDSDIQVIAQDQFVTLTFDYIDSISQQVVTVYEGERERWLVDRNTLRASLVQALVEGRATDVEAAEAALGYRLRGSIHLALVLWNDDTDTPGFFDTAVGLLSRALGAGRPSVRLARDGTSVWAWMTVGEARPVSAAQLRDALSVMPTPPLVAVGGPHPGVEGFRRSHEEALRAQAVAVLRDEDANVRALSYTEPGLALAALVCHDLPAARDWVHAVLGPMARNDQQHQRLRDTARLLLEHGGNHTAAAEALSMHRNTVRYRIARFEETLGRPLSEDRQATDVALTICHWLGSSVLTPVI